MRTLTWPTSFAPDRGRGNPPSSRREDRARREERFGEDDSSHHGDGADRGARGRRNPHGRRQAGQYGRSRARGRRCHGGEELRRDRLQAAHEKPNILGVGDVNGKYMFTHVAGAEGSVAVRRIALHAGGSMNYAHVPWVTYTDPELASVGYSETRRRRRVSITRRSFSRSGRPTGRRPKARPRGG